MEQKLVTPRLPIYYRIAAAVFIGAIALAGLWAAVLYASGAEGSAAAAAAGLSGAIVVVLVLLYVEIAFIRLTSQGIEQRRRGRRIRVPWSSVREVSWWRDWQIIQGDREKISIRPASYSNGEEIATIITRMTNQGRE